MDEETGEDGSFRVALEDGEAHTLVVEPQGVLSTAEFENRVFTARNAAPAMRKGIVPGSAPLVIRLEPGLEVTGRVLDRSGEGVSGALIIARSVPGDEGHEALAHATTDGSGSFTLTGLAARAYFLEAVRIPGGDRGYARNVLPGSADVEIVLRK